MVVQLGGKRGKGSYPITSPALTTPFLSKGTALELGSGGAGAGTKKIIIRQSLDPRYQGIKDTTAPDRHRLGLELLSKGRARHTHQSS